MLPAELLNVQIDGVWHQFPKGTRVIEACSKARQICPALLLSSEAHLSGKLPHVSDRDGHAEDGPDRKPEIGEDGKPMINWIPRPQISCAQDIAEGMGVRTDSPLVQECRNGVMEFLLINHPLDCPICDQAGECQLQEFCVEYGTAGPGFSKKKSKSRNESILGRASRSDDERCILCSRCIRFMKEVANDDVLGFADRGSSHLSHCASRQASTTIIRSTPWIFVRSAR